MLKYLVSVVIVCCFFNSSTAQTPHVRCIQASSNQVSIRDGASYYPNAWTVSPALKPDLFESAVAGTKLIVFITDKDSIGFAAEADKTYDFIIILNGKDSAWTRIKTTRFTEPAVFSKPYITAHNNKTFVEIPEAYELLNIIFALTETGKNDPDIVEHGDYLDEVTLAFKRFGNEPIVKTIDGLLQQNRYFVLKMDAYAFEIDASNKLVQSKVYDRVSWGVANTLRPYVPLLNDFIAHSGFRNFYRAHNGIYQRQIRCYRDTLQTGEMQKWLNRNFPDTRYNSFKIIFSPLVSGNQSANWFENNGFKEAQAHVNFPYTNGNWLKGLSSKASQVKRGNIVFTELNHAFINPEGEKKQYQKGITSAFSDLSKWEDMTKAAKNYGDAYQCFNEYMNWALVSLRYVDYAPLQERDKLIAQNDTYMTEGRGFKKFREFDQFLVKLYRAKKPAETVADLYPAIVSWFGNN